METSTPSQDGGDEKGPVGSRPLTPDQLLRLDNRPAEVPVPADVARQLSVRRLILSVPDQLPEPTQLKRPEARLNSFQWELPERAVVGLPGRSATVVTPGSLHSSINPRAWASAFRPAWASPTYHPKQTVPPSWVHRPVPVKGGVAELFYGVYPPENRAVYFPMGYPWQCVGKVFVWNNALAENPVWSGSAVLAGPRVVLTAGHVVPWDAPSWKMHFVPAYFDGSSVAGAGANSWVTDAHGWDVSYKSRVPDAFDLAVLRLNDPLGSSLGYFGAYEYRSDLNGADAFDITGYPVSISNGERPSYEQGISVLDTDPNTDALKIEHHGDTTPGDSGAPLWGTWPDGFPYAIGTVSGGETVFEAKEHSNEDNNIAAGGRSLVELILWARANWP